MTNTYSHGARGLGGSRGNAVRGADGALESNGTRVLGRWWSVKFGFGLMFGAILLLAGAHFFAMSNNDATSAARAWADDMGYHGAGVHCQKWDNDGNGKVSCDVRLPDGELIPLDCSCFPTEECTQRKMVDFPERRRR